MGEATDGRAEGFEVGDGEDSLTSLESEVLWEDFTLEDGFC